MSGAKRVVVAGLGSIGRRHLGNVRRLLPDADVTVWRHRASDEAKPAEADRVVASIDDVRALRPEIAIVATPAPYHVDASIALAEMGAHLLIEKPLSDSLLHLDALAAACRERRLTWMVGYTLRFSAGLRRLRDAVREGRIGRVLSIHAEVGQYLPEWRPSIDYRQSVSARRALGGGALLELSHEIDAVRWVAGEVSEVAARVGKVSDLDIDVEDCVDLLLTMSSGVTATVHMDFFRRPTVRRHVFVGTEGSLEWDAVAGTCRVYDAATSAWSTLDDASTRERNDMYLAELTHFLECIRTGATPIVTGEDGRRVVEIVSAARRASESRTTVAL
jgi:predicted dehydrogenase